MGKDIKPRYNFKYVLLITAFLLVAVTVFAQNVPAVQKNSLFTPANLKIDGRATEWNDQFQAYNKATKLFCTIANNNEALYISVKATDPTTVIKILTNGITFTVNNTSTNTHASITFPLTKKNDLANVKNGVRKKTTTTADSAMMLKAADSTAKAWNGQLAIKLKEIKIEGVKELSDTISVYNDSGIKTALLLDNRKACTYELAVPLKYLGSNPGSFNYSIQLNGSPLVKGLTVQISSNGRAIDRTFEGTTVSMPASDEQIAMEFPTGFKAKYTLAKQ